MNYDESVFKEKANRRARRIWLIFAVLLSANYGADVANHLRGTTYYLIFLALCWLPIIIGEILLRVKGFATDLYKFNLVIGYGIFYTFVVCTTESPIAFTYVLPVTSLLVLYKNKKFMVGCGIVNSLIIVGSAAYRMMLGFQSASNMKDYQLELACIILCYVCYVMSIKHLNESDGAMTDSIRADLQRVITTVEQVKQACNTIMNGVTVVRELASENSHGATIVVNSLHKLNEHNTDLQNSTASSNQMTSDIHAQVNHVAEMIEQMVALTTTSIQHAKVSSADLADLVTTTNTMASLSGEIEQTLQNFKAEFAMVKKETGIIENNYLPDEPVGPECFHRSCPRRRCRKRLCRCCRADTFLKRRNQDLFRSDQTGLKTSGRHRRKDDRLHGRNPAFNPAYPYQGDTDRQQYDGNRFRHHADWGKHPGYRQRHERSRSLQPSSG